MSILRLMLVAVVLLPSLVAQKVLYVHDTGKQTTPERISAFETFLGKRFTEVRTRNHDTYDQKDGRWADVVMLDWHQGGVGIGIRPQSPLGRRATWNRPTVLIGSAGLNTAMAWDVFGGSG